MGTIIYKVIVFCLIVCPHKPTPVCCIRPVVYEGSARNGFISEVMPRCFATVRIFFPQAFSFRERLMQGEGFGNAQISIWAFAAPLLCNGADLLSPGFLVSRKADAVYDIRTRVKVSYVLMLFIPLLAQTCAVPSAL